MDELNITVEPADESGAVAVRVEGEVDVSNADALRTALDGTFSHEPFAVEVDLAAAPYIDSTGIGVLVGAAHRAADAGIPFRVAHAQRNVARVIAMLGLDRELHLDQA